MASAWGDSWGSAWGDSWGAIAAVEDAAGYIDRPRRRRYTARAAIELPVRRATLVVQCRRIRADVPVREAGAPLPVRRAGAVVIAARLRAVDVTLNVARPAPVAEAARQRAADTSIQGRTPTANAAVEAVSVRVAALSVNGWVEQRAAQREGVRVSRAKQARRRREMEVLLGIPLDDAGLLR